MPDSGNGESDMKPQWHGVLADIMASVQDINKRTDAMQIEVMDLENHLKSIGAPSAQILLDDGSPLTYARHNGQFRIIYNAKPWSENDRHSKIVAYNAIEYLLIAIKEECLNIAKRQPALENK